MDPSPQNIEPVTTEKAIGEEAAAIHGPAFAAKLHDAILDAKLTGAHVDPAVAHRMVAFDLGQSALCLSGGGIRSAAFALGVMQGLARRQVLHRFHYLSTVSGGGYAGGWLQNVLRDATDPATEIEKTLGVSARLSAEPKSVSWLRAYSNFLTPQVGLASTDTWASAIMVIRNILLNWLIFAPALVLLVVAVQVYRDIVGLGAGNVLAAGPWRRSGDYWPAFCVVIGAAIYAWTIVRTCPFIPSHRFSEGTGSAKVAGGRTGGATRPAGQDGGFLRTHIVLWSTAASFLMPIGAVPSLYTYWPTIQFLTGAILVASFIGYVVAWYRARPNAFAQILFEINWVPWAAASLASAALAGLGPYLAVGLAGYFWSIDAHAVMATATAVAGPLWLTVCHMLLMSLYIAFRNTRSFPSDPDREWLARLSAIHINLAAAWFAMGLAVIALPRILFEQWGVFGPWFTAILAAVTGPIAVLGGKSGSSALDLLHGGATAGKRGNRSLGLIVPIGTFVFLVILLTVTSHWTSLLVGSLGTWIGEVFHHHRPWSRACAYVVLATAAGTLLWFASSRIKVNRFSLHTIYRNRLVRGFLGAARNDARTPDPFTGYDPDDNPRMGNLWPGPGWEMTTAGRAVQRGGTTAMTSLFPVVNVTLNLLGSTRLAWQERKAASFTITPLRCGSNELSRAAAMPGDPELPGAFVATCDYAGQEVDEKDQAARNAVTAHKTARLTGESEEAVAAGNTVSGISLGTAMTISGAAVSPGMGYHSSPATSLLMTLFNVRLGSWLPNPAVADAEALHRAGPEWALRPLLYEMFGLSNEKRADIYLSDGGHFENLGLYEMVRRGCRYVVVSDAGADGDAGFADLGNAIRKIGIDLGIEIKITALPWLHCAPAQRVASAVAHATIHYDHRRVGDLIYIKPTLLDDLPVDIEAYYRASPDFPHEGTADQFFSESQFESYRHLGEHLVDRIAGPANPYASVSDFIAKLKPADPAAEARTDNSRESD